MKKTITVDREVIVMSRLLGMMAVGCCVFTLFAHYVQANDHDVQGRKAKLANPAIRIIAVQEPQPRLVEASFEAPPLPAIIDDPEVPDETDVAPTFTADIDGSYNLSLVVNDGLVGSNADNVTVTAATANSAAVANAGADQSVTPNDLVILDGSTSSDADGDVLSYSWTLVSVPAGSSASLSDQTDVAPTFTADLTGDYVLRLIVNANSGLIITYVYIRMIN